MKCYLYPDAEKSNPFLVQKVKDNYVYRVQGGGERTDFNFHQKKIQEVDNLILWIQSILPKVSYEFSQDGEDFCEIEKVGFDTNAFEIKECWGVIYNKGTGVVIHNHFPYALSFVYFVNMPNESSSIIIEDEKIMSKEGSVLFFLSHKYHEVKPTGSNGRCVISGNVLYQHNFQ